MSDLRLFTTRPGDPEAAERGAVAVPYFPFVVGRGSGCDHRLDDPTVSRRHCLFSQREGRAWVEDLGSRNGTLLNEAPLTEARPVADGDRLRLGRLALHVRLQEAPAAAPGERGAAPGGSGPAAQPFAAPVVQAGGAQPAPAPF
jgi:predicted component of type VI protein secretion system